MYLYSTVVDRPFDWLDADFPVAVYDMDTKGVIFSTYCATSLPFMALVWTYLHEYGHSLQHSRGLMGPEFRTDPARDEIEADEFACTFLMEKYRLSRLQVLKCVIESLYSVDQWDIPLDACRTEACPHPHIIDRLLMVLA